MSNSDLHPNVKRFIDAFNDHGVDAIMAEVADGGTLLDPSLEKEISGSELREYNNVAIEAFPDIHLEVERGFTGPEGTTVVEWTLSGTHRGEWEGLPPTGNSVTLPGCSIVNVSDGGITFWRDYFDQQATAEQLGLTFPHVILQLPILAWRKGRSILGI